MRKLLFSIFLLFVAGSTYGQNSHLEGHWRRIAPLRGSIPNEMKPQSGDFIFKRDSTFTLVGDTSTLNYHYPGWQADDKKLASGHYPVNRSFYILKT